LRLLPKDRFLGSAAGHPLFIQRQRPFGGMWESSATGPSASLNRRADISLGDTGIISGDTLS
jgi:hypothetical protein